MDHVHLTHPITPQSVFSDDVAAALHNAALGVVEREGMKILLPEARSLFAQAGARVAKDMEFICRDIVQSAPQTAPRQWRMRAANPAHARLYAAGQALFGSGAGCPNATDLARGRRPGTLRDDLETLVLQQSFDVIHILGPSVEPQDVPAPLRHYTMTQAQITRAEKPMFVYARGRAQVQDSLHMIRLGLNLADDDWASGVWAYTVINTNAPRQLDNPMAQATLAVHAAGWLEGGLSFGSEEFISDIEALQTLAKMCVRPGDTVDDFALDALAEVPPGGHFFATAQRATTILQRPRADFQPPSHGPEAAARLAPYIAARTAAGGAPPLD